MKTTHFFSLQGSFSFSFLLILILWLCSIAI